MLRGNNSRTRGEILGLNKQRNGPRHSWNPSTRSGSSERPMTTPRSESKVLSTRQNRIAPPIPTTTTTTPIPKTRTPLSHHTDGFSQQEIRELKECFRLFDVEGTGTISVGSFRAVLESLLDNEEQPYPHLEEILRLLSDRSDEEILDFDGYVSLMASTSLQQRLQSGNADDPPNFQHVFDLFDVDRKGYITLEDLHRVALDLGEHDMTTNELQEMIDRARSKKTGQVTLKEFTKIMTLNLFQKMDETAADMADDDEKIQPLAN